MNLIALLIGLVIERLATQLFHWRRMRWLDHIIDYGFRQAERLPNWPAIVPVILLALVLVLPVFVVIWLLGGTLAGFTYLLLAIVVLYLFLRQVSTTLIVISSVPFSLLITLGALSRVR